MIKNYLPFLAKAIVTVFLLNYIQEKLHSSLINFSLSIQNVSLLVLSVLPFYLNLLLVSFRWVLLLSKQRLGLSFIDTLKIQLKSNFLNQLLPSGLVGELIKVIFLKNVMHNLSDSVSFVIFERFLGLFVLALISFLSSITMYYLCDLKEELIFNFLLLNLLGLLLFYILYNFTQIKSKRYKLGNFGVYFSLAKFIGWINTFFALGIRNVSFVLVICIIIHLVTISSFFIISKCVLVNIPLTGYLILPVVILLSAIPISIAGWGVREGLMVIGLGLVGIKPSDALSLSILFGLISLVAYLPAALLFFFGRSYEQ